MYFEKTPLAQAAKGDESTHGRKRVYRPSNHISDIRILTLSGSGHKDEALTEKRFKSMLKDYARVSL